MQRLTAGYSKSRNQTTRFNDAQSNMVHRMCDAKIVHLADRGVVSVTGADAGKLLAGIITNDMALLDKQRALFAGLLNPQGKILFEFFVIATDGGYLLDTARERAPDLIKRLGLYRLRAKVEIRDVGSELLVAAKWGGSVAPANDREFVDPRRPELGMRLLVPVTAATETNAVPADYQAHRIALGVPEGGKDYDLGDAYPHEANFDLLGGVSFDKGCYVGQEVVARMQHKAVIRKRVVKVTAADPLPQDRAAIMAGDAIIGRLGSVAERSGLAMRRLDRVMEAMEKGVPIVSETIALDVDRGALARYAASAAAHRSTTT